MNANPYNRVANIWITDATEELNAALDALTRLLIQANVVRMSQVYAASLDRSIQRSMASST